MPRKHGPARGLRRMALREYARKRDFSKTPEPGPDVARRSPRAPLRFTVQKHDASHLHYDFRLELDGVLKSWAVPKGPSLNPKVRRLAMQVEDHPVSYGDFEGTIPAGQYGGGTVLLWDVGTWTPLDPDPREALRKGSLKFELAGRKLRGSWALVHAFGRDRDDRGNSWLLIKHKDAEARASAEITEAQPLSIKTGRDLDEIAADRRGPVHSSNRAPAAAKPRRKPARPAKASRPRVRASDLSAIAGARPASLRRAYSPQLCTLADHVPEGEEWVHEIKFDGYRFLAYRDASGVTLISRRGNDWTSRFRPIAEAIAQLPPGQFVLDGEAVVIDERGKTTFQALQKAIKAQRFERLAFYVFDVLYVDGFDLTRAALLARKKVLRGLIPDRADAMVRYSDHVAGGGSEVRQQACRLGLEGVISKRADAPYTQARAPTWLKIKCGLRQEFIVVGYTGPKGSRRGFGSLILGAHDASGQLVHTGRVGTGFNADLLKEIAGRLRSVKSPPLDVMPPREVIRGVRWVKPELVAEVSFTEWTEDGRLRHPSFEGLREDKSAREVRIEMPRHTAVIAADLKQSFDHAEPAKPQATARPTKSASGGRKKSSVRASKSADHDEGGATVEGVVITNPDRVLYPDAELTKLDIARYYDDVAELILPHVVARPLSTLRCPSGQPGPCFFQKHIRDTFTEPVHPMRVKEKDGEEDLISIDSKAGLIKLAQLGVLEIHPWGSKHPQLERPDLLTFDLDPGPGVAFKDVKIAARRVREVLDGVELESFIKTSGGKGLHVVVPLTPKADWDTAKSFAAAVARRMEEDEPDRYVSSMSKARRAGRIFVDYLRNGRGATSVAPYSTRARAGAPVSMPIGWDELARLKDAGQYTVKNARAYLSRRRKDPWERLRRVKQQLPTGA